MSGRNLFKFLPHPHFTLPFAILLKYQIFLGSIHFALLRGGTATYCIFPECSFHGWLKIVTVLYPFQMMSGFMIEELGFFLWFRSLLLLESMNNIQSVPKSRLYLGEIFRIYQDPRPVPVGSGRSWSHDHRCDIGSEFGRRQSEKSPLFRPFPLIPLTLN